MTSSADSPEPRSQSVEELEARVAELARANAELVDADRRKDELLATLAHDLRNPLAAVGGSVELLLMPDVDLADQQHIRDVLRRQLQQLSRVVDQLRDNARSLRGQNRPAAPTEEPQAFPPNPRRRRILLVDDNIDVTESFARLLTLIDQEVRTAHDGTTALHLAQSFRPEIILLDIGLPEVDGYEVARRIRQLPGMDKVLLAALTGQDLDDARGRCLEAGFDQHLVKPVSLKTIEKLLSLTEPGASLPSP